ncbi:zinc-binding dehydrogenase [Desertimonas flava]|uniref:zinc-binding dehydrogenase n=1 Tax=Desertimonas flava TaxID=2064846 RepID=UPI000E343CA9|nr:zinc-binding dehydrogenase [Desertimonas flava]
MRAVALRDQELHVRDDVAEPTPETGQVLVAVKACGICGSDLHFAKHAAEMKAIGEEMGGLPMRLPSADLTQDVFMGHEFAAEVLAAGPNTATFAPGTLVTSVPMLMSGFGVSAIGFGNAPPAGYGERMLLSAPLLQEVPNGLDARRAALTEPMAVGLHAVNKARLEPGDGTIVLGCGPVGLAVIAALRQRGVDTILAADFSPARRALAATMGASQVIDPASESAFDIWLTDHGTKPPVVFEAVGVTGMIDAVLRDVVPQTRVVVVGVCMGRDPITPLWAITKELNLQFVLGYDLEEFAASLRSIAEGEIDVDPLITGEVGLDGVAGAFDDLGNPDRHCKILVTP